MTLAFRSVRVLGACPRRGLRSLVTGSRRNPSRDSRVQVHMRACRNVWPTGRQQQCSLRQRQYSRRLQRCPVPRSSTVSTRWSFSLVAWRMRASGATARCTGRAKSRSLLLMGGFTKENFATTIGTARGKGPSLVGGGTKGSGATIKDMVRVPMSTATGKRARESGIKAGCTGRSQRHRRTAKRTLRCGAMASQRHWMKRSPALAQIHERTQALLQLLLRPKFKPPKNGPVRPAGDHMPACLFGERLLLWTSMFVTGDRVQERRICKHDWTGDSCPLEMRRAFLSKSFQ